MMMVPMNQMMQMLTGGKGGGGGWKGGGGGGNWKKPPTTGKVSRDFTVDAYTRYQGTVQKYSKMNGYGFIELKDKSAVPGGKVFVFWKSIDSDDRFPSLTQGMDVELSLHKSYERSTKTNKVRAKNVTLPGGGKIA